VLDQIGAGADDAGDEHGAFGQLELFERSPPVLMTRIRGFDREAAGAHLEDDVDDLRQGDVWLLRREPAVR